jgi:hypothetical protein
VIAELEVTEEDEKGSPSASAIQPCGRRDTGWFMRYIDDKMV